MLCSLFLMIRRPPRSTPFPFTTPFRSRAGYHAAEREADHALAVPREREPNARHRHQAGALGRGPRFAVGRVEAVLHDPHDGIEVEYSAFGDGDRRGHHGIRPSTLTAASLGPGLASGARP